MTAQLVNPNGLTAAGLTVHECIGLILVVDRSLHSDRQWARLPSDGCEVLCQSCGRGHSAGRVAAEEEDDTARGPQAGPRDRWGPLWPTTSPRATRRRAGGSRSLPVGPRLALLRFYFFFLRFFIFSLFICSHLFPARATPATHTPKPSNKWAPPGFIYYTISLYQIASGP